LGLSTRYVVKFLCLVGSSLCQLFETDKMGVLVKFFCQLYEDSLR
jgi:hypothetical protein